MPFSLKRLSFNAPPANGLASQSTKQPRPVCTWSAHDPQSRSSPSPFPRSSHTLTATATSTAAGELFLFGGYVHGCASSDLYAFSTRDFSPTLLHTSGEVPTPRVVHGAALIGTTTLLIYGGITNFGDQNVLNQRQDDSLYLLNLVSRKWTRVVVNGPGPGGRYYHTVTMIRSELFVFGGVIGGKSHNDVWALDLNSLNSQPLWKSYKPAPGNEKPHPRTGHVSVSTEDRIIVFGGSGNLGYYNDTWSFDISTRKWTELQCSGSIPSPRTGHAAVLVDDVMYVFGGFTGKTYLDDLIALQLSTKRWFKFRNEGKRPRRRSGHTMTSDGTRVFVLGGGSKDARVDQISLVHVFDTKDIKYPDLERNAVHPNERTTQPARESTTGLPAQEQPQHAEFSSSEVQGASRLQNANPAVSGRSASLQITHEQNPDPNGRPSELTGVNSRPRPEDDVSEGSTEYHAESAAPHPSSEGEVPRLELVRQLSVSLAAQTERDQLIAQLTDELALKNTLLEQAEANATEAKKHEGLKLRELQAKLDDLLLSRDQHVRAFERAQSALQDATSRATDTDEQYQRAYEQIGQHEEELASVRAKLEAKESELEAVRLRLVDAEKGLTKSRAEADALPAQAATGFVNRNEDQVSRLLERVQALEAERDSKWWNEKGRIESMVDNNEE